MGKPLLLVYGPTCGLNSVQVNYIIAPIQNTTLRQKEKKKQKQTKHKRIIRVLGRVFQKKKEIYQGMLLIFPRQSQKLPNLACLVGLFIPGQETSHE